MNDKAIPKIHNGHVLGTTAVLFVPMAIFLSKSIAPLFAIAAVSVLVMGILRNRSVALIPGPVTFFLAALTGWALITWFWSITPGVTLKTGISLVGTFFGGAVLWAGVSGLGAQEKKILHNGMILGGAMGFPLIAFEFATDAWLSQFLYGLAGKKLFLIEGGHISALNTGMASTVLFFWPWALAMRSRFSARVAGLGIAAAFGLFLLSNADAVIVGLGAGAIVFAFGVALPRHAPKILALLVAVGVVTAPMVPGLFPNPVETGVKITWLSPSAMHRIVIWRNTVTHIKQKPLLGAGFDTARALYSNKDKVIYFYPKSKSTGKQSKVKFEPIPLHPHNGILQVWLELGGVGALILLGLLVSILYAITRSFENRFNRAAALAMFTAGLSIASISFGAWQSWWLTSIFLAAAFMVSMFGPDAGAVEEIGGPKGPEPTRYGDWERKGRAIDF